MSILIKGMKMPKSCYECTVRYACDAYWEYKAEHPYDIKSNGRMEDCPLVEIPKHGRLIDADKLKADNPRHMNADVPYVTEVTVEEIIDEAPTIIEGEEE